MADNRPQLKWGSKGPVVAELQRFLNVNLRGLNPKLIPDGIFGKNTYDAVKAFQTQVGLTDDGVVGPNTWAKIDGDAASTPEPAEDKSNYPSPPNANVPLQKTPHDCGFFSGYFLARGNERGAVQGLSYTEQDVLDAKKRFLAANNLPDVYLGPHNVPGFLQSIGLGGFTNQSAIGVFRHDSDELEALKFLLNRIGQSGVMVAVQTFASGSRSVEGHWFVIAGSKRVEDDILFLVYDSSDLIPKDRRKAGLPAGAGLCWVRARWLIAHLKVWLPLAFMSKT